MGTITYTPQAEDYIAAAKLEMRLQTRKNWLGLVFVAVFFGGLGGAMLLDPRSKIAVQGGWMLAICAFAFSVAPLRYYILLPRQIRKGFRLRPQKPVRIEWHEAHLISEDEVVKVTGPWPEFTGWLESKEVFILFFRGTRFQIVPTRAFTDPAAMRSFHDMLLSKLGPAGVMRK